MKCTGGYAEWSAFLDIADERDFAYELLKRCADFAAEPSKAVVERFTLDWLWTDDDVSSQVSMLVSPASWRMLIKPHLARVAAV